MSVSLGELAAQFGCELIGDPQVRVSNVAALQNAKADSLTFLANPAFNKQLPDTRAAAVILRPDVAQQCRVAALLSDDPYATYARMAAVIYVEESPLPGIHASAVVAEDAEVAATAHVAANAVIAERAHIGENVIVGAGCFVGPDCRVGNASQIAPNATLAKRVRLGQRCIVHHGVVIGADGFGNAMTPDGWLKVPQVGGVDIGDDVEIGANSTIDCGAIGDTVIGDGVRIDNQCMIAHNVRIGEHTAMAATTAIAGSAVIGKRCLFAGRSGSVGHITICDDVVIGAMSFVSKNISEPGTYLASFPAEKASVWTKQVARFRRLGSLAEKVKKLQK